VNYPFSSSNPGDQKKAMYNQYSEKTSQELKIEAYW